MADKISAMREGGKKLAEVKACLRSAASVGMSFAELESIAQKEIAARGAQPSFSTVPGYSWATCIMKNDAVCHGIPEKKHVIADGDVITIDVGLINHGFHLDTTTTLVVGNADENVTRFLEIGIESLQKAIAAAVVGNSVYDVSFAMEKPLRVHGYGVVYQLTGHGVGEQLHMEPSIPCIPQRRDKKKRLYAGQTLAIENMYTMGDSDLVLASDGWTYVTQDGSLSAMFEETVLITENGPEVLTKLI